MQYNKSVVSKPNFPQLRGSLASMQYPAFAEVKFDGELNYVVHTPTDAFTINKYGTVRKSWPALNKIHNVLTSEGVKSAMMLGELYWNRGKKGELYTLLSHKTDDNCKLALFDMIELNGDSLKRVPLIERREIMLDCQLRTYIVPFETVEDTTHVIDIAKETLNMGYEGIVVKALNSRFVQGPCNWVKLKYHDRSDYKVVLIDPTKERIEIEVPSATQTAYKWLKVGCKAPNKYKKHIKIGDMVTIEHQGVLASGSLRHPVLIPKKGW